MTIFYKSFYLSVDRLFHTDNIHDKVVYLTRKTIKHWLGSQWDTQRFVIQRQRERKMFAKVNVRFVSLNCFWFFRGTRRSGGMAGDCPWHEVAASRIVSLGSNPSHINMKAFTTNKYCACYVHIGGTPRWQRSLLGPTAVTKTINRSRTLLIVNISSRCKIFSNELNNYYLLKCIMSSLTMWGIHQMNIGKWQMWCCDFRSVNPIKRMMLFLLCDGYR